MSHTVRSRLVVLSLAWLVPILALAAVGAVAYHRARAQAVTRANLELARATAASFSAYVEGVVEEAAVLADAVATGLPADDRDRLLAGAAARRPSIRSFSWVTPEGRVVASSNPAAVGLELGDRDYVREIRRGAEWMLGDLAAGRLDGTPLFGVAHAARRPDGALAGIVVAAVAPDRLDVRALRLLQLEDAAVAIFDRNGRRVYRNPAPPAGWARWDPSTQEIVKAALRGREATGAVRSEATGDDWRAAAVPISPLGWVARAARPEATVVAAIHRGLLWQAGITLGVALAVLAASVWVGGWIVRPLRRLEDRAGRLLRGEPQGTDEPRERAPREIAALTEAFDRMANGLAARRRREEDERLRLEQVFAERERILEHLRDSEERFRRAVIGAPFPIMIRDEAGRVVQLNVAWLRITGYSPEELPTVAAWAERAYGERKDEILRTIREHDASGQPLVIELPVRTRDGRELTWSISVAALGTVGGRRLYAAMAVDVTEQRAAEAALREADRRKDEFLAVLSHELRNPLAPIRNSLAILRRAAPGSEQATRSQQVMERQVSHITRLVDDLLDVSRIARGKIQVRRDPLDLGEVVRRAADDHRGLVERRGLAFEVAVPDGPLWLEGDEVRLAQVVGNLLQNAAKFTAPGGRVALDVSQEGEHAVVRVRDTGIGLEPGSEAGLFEPFVQAKQGIDRSQGGLGLGLALVKGLVAHHGGTVEARSGGPGHGSEFAVRLPLGAAAAAVSAAAHRAPTSGRSGPVRALAAPPPRR